MILNLIASIVWLATSIIWTHMTIKDPCDVLNWVSAGLSLIACVLYFIVYYKQLKEKK